MSQRKNFTDEMLNKFVDGELEPADEKVIFTASLNDPDLQEHINELRQVRAIVRQTLQTGAGEISSKRTAANHSRRNVLSLLAASLLLAVGIALGLTMNPPALMTNTWTDMGPSPFTTPSRLLTAGGDEEVRAIVHVSTADSAAMRLALDEVEGLLRTYRARKRPLHLEILVNAEGLDHFRQGISPFAGRLASLRQEYPNISFLACANTIKRLKVEKNIEAKLLPGVMVVPSALDQILLRLNSGWSYIKA